MEDFVIGIDFGGTNTAFGMVSRQGAVLASGSIKTRQEEGPTRAIGRIRKALLDLSAERGIDLTKALGVGVGSPGPLDVRTGALYDPPNLAPDLWHGFPLATELSRILQLPVRLDNDANAAALAEYWVGSACGCGDFIVLTLGTGVGSGAFVGGVLLRGATGVGAEMGHICIDPAGDRCGCGSRGCLECYASSSGLLRIAYAAAESGEHSESALVRACVRREAQPEQIFAASRTGDVFAKRIVREYGTRLGVGVASLLNVFNPAVVVFAGGVSKAFDQFSPHTRRVIRKRAFPLAVDAVELRTSSLGDDSGIIGAAAVFLYDSANALAAGAPIKGGVQDRGQPSRREGA